MAPATGRRTCWRSQGSRIPWREPACRRLRFRGTTLGTRNRSCSSWPPAGSARPGPEEEADYVRPQIEATGASSVVVLDGSAYFNRPGPRLVDSLELLVASR